MNLEAVFQWAEKRGLLETQLPEKTIDKILEEVNELSDEMFLGSPDVKTELGDVLFATCVLAFQLGLDPDACLDAAIAKNWNRKGRIINGLFVKREDL